MKKRLTIRLTPEAIASLEALFTALGWGGQRGTSFNAGLEELGRTASGAMAETIAGLKIASGCAAGEDRDELVEIIHPEYGDE